MRKKVLLINLPPLETNAPPLALATLKGAIKKHHDITCFDFNLYVNKKLNINEFSIHESNNQKKFEDITIECFKNTNYDVIGISILSQWQERTAELVISILKEITKSKIVVGGPYFVYSNQQNFNMDFYKDNVDAYIVGDGELSFKEYLDGNVDYSGINDYKYDINFDRNIIDFPDYSDFNLSDYTELQVGQSKGCVRKCSFCTIPAVWPKYVYKSGERMAEEIENLYNSYLINMESKKIHFVDSLINGSKKLLLETSHNIINKFGKNHNKFWWGGQAIATSEKHIPRQAYKLAAQAGLKYLIVGVESGSEKVRWEMNKKFYDIDLYYTLSICRKYKINIVPLMIIGFPTETESDFQKTLDFLELYKNFSNKQISIKPFNTSLMSLGPNMEITINLDKYTIKNIKNNWNWNSNYHDLNERIQRLYRYAEKAYELKLSDLSPEEFVEQCIPYREYMFQTDGYALTN